MAKYEIMLIVDPKEDFAKVESFVQKIFKSPQIKKMDRTELAYEINKSKTAMYLLIDVEAHGEEIKELTRKINISKTIWRMMVVNLDTEIGREEGLKKIAARKKAYEEFKKEALAKRELMRKKYRERAEKSSQEKQAVTDTNTQTEAPVPAKAD